MSRMNHVFIWLILILFLVIPLKAAQGIIITYESADLFDIVSGEDLWQYTYTVSDHTFAKDTGFTIWFDNNAYADVEDFDFEDTADGIWNLLSWDPDISQPSADGAFDALSNIDAPILPYSFVIDFVWIGAGTPGIQPFDVYALFEGNELTLLDSGITAAAAAPVPEPATLLLLGSGLVGLLGFRRRKPRSS